MKELARESKLTSKSCPCCSGRDYAECCGPFHEGAPAPTPEALMRSRYSAFSLGLSQYLLKTWAEENRPQTLSLDDGTEWLNLKVIKASEDGDKGIVNFIAKGKVGSKTFRMHEISRFVRREGKWYYLDGTQIK